MLALFEGVATGAADGYGRMAGKPAATLLHLGPGLGNGLANLHNARRARTPIVNIVGDHATYHQALDAPLASDIVGGREQRVALGARVEGAGDASAPMSAEAISRGPPGWRRDADPARRRVVARRRRTGPVAVAAATRRGAVHRRRDRGRGRRRCAAASRPRCCVGGGALRERRSARGVARSRRRRAPSSCARRSRPGSNGARVCPRSSGSVTSPSSRSRSCRACAISCSSTPRSRCRSSRIRTCRACSRRTAARSTSSSRDGPFDVDDALEALADALGAPRRRCGARGPRHRPDRPTGPLNPETIAQGDRRAAARRRDRQRRGEHGRTVRLGRDRGCAPPRLADAHRRRDRPGHARRDRRRGRVSRPQGAQPRGRRQRDVHAAVAVDAGPRGPRRHDDHLRQPVVRDPEPRAVARRRAHRRQRGRPVRHLAPAARLRRARAREWASTAYASRPPTSSSAALERALHEPGPYLIDAIIPARL